MGYKASNFFSKDQKDQIVQAIIHAESDTSGEIRIHVENNCYGDVLDRAAYIFKKLKMHKTVQRNGVLIYFSVLHKKFAIIGDAGINEVVPENFWNQIKDNMSDEFKKDNFTDGLINAILKTGEQLKNYFPHQKNDVNELSDDISFGND